MFRSPGGVVCGVLCGCACVGVLVKCVYMCTFVCMSLSYVPALTFRLVAIFLRLIVAPPWMSGSNASLEYVAFAQVCKSIKQHCLLHN